MEKPMMIEKELLDREKFVKSEVLQNPEERIRRRESIEKAMRFGNNDKGKIAIIFDSANGTRRVETTVWSVTENNVILKQGKIIPIHCIREVKLYPAS